jgi:catechol 2,3-dioxygenase-like lactoylglutathione lyase family enzyme
VEGRDARPIGFDFIAHADARPDDFTGRVGGQIEPNLELGGGQMIRFTDPAGFALRILFGWTDSAPLAPIATPIENTALNRTRLGRPARSPKRPSQVYRLGHVLVRVPNLQECVEFYSRHLGFRPSDTYFGGVQSNVVASFMHCGLGKTFTDHHTIAFVKGEAAQIDHSAFEVLDLNDLLIGHDFLKGRSHAHSWGIGRHIDGSQIFDYWIDPFGNKVEHWTDGDLVNDEYKGRHVQFSPHELAQWGPPWQAAG